MEENQSYEIEKKEGNIVKVENASEKQKQQKIKLKKTIATFCVGIGIAIGAGTLMHSTYENKEETMSTIEEEKNNEYKTIHEHLETEDGMKTVMSMIDSYSSIDKEKSNELDQALNLLLNSNNNSNDKEVYIYKSVDDVGFRLCHTNGGIENWTLCGKLRNSNFSEDLLMLDESISTNNQVWMYQLQTRKKNMETGEYGPWMDSNEIFSTINGKLPADTETSRYIYKGVENSSVENYKVKYEDLHLYQLSNIEQTSEKNYNVGLSDFIIANENFFNNNANNYDGKATWIDRGLLKVCVNEIMNNMISNDNQEISIEKTSQELGRSR